MIKVLFLFGTRPEAIKMAPLIKSFSSDDFFDVRVAVTAQHREMLDQVLSFFDIEVDYDLNIMKANQTLHKLTADLISDITTKILLDEKFDLVFVQGDTTTVLSAALAAFYQKIPVAHIEAGLRSHDMHSPFPEEMNRVLTSNISKYHFCPTETAVANLRKENFNDNIYQVGNTVIDALLIGLQKLNTADDTEFLHKFKPIDFDKKTILVTCHRRENFGAPFSSICDALMELAAGYGNEIQIVYPVHLNPNVREVAHTRLTAHNIFLIDPLDYPELIWMMNKSYIILTDSGGIQEEAPSLGKPVLVMREVTERTEGVEAGTAILVGSNRAKIVDECTRLLNDAEYYGFFKNTTNPYGDGNTSSKIKAIIRQDFLQS